MNIDYNLNNEESLLLDNLKDKNFLFLYNNPLAPFLLQCLIF